MFSALRGYIKRVRDHSLAVVSTLTSIRPGSLIFQCNVCGKRSITATNKLGRETISCLYCGSTVRMRFIVHALSTILYGESLVLRDFLPRHEVRVVGLSDWDGYANPLARKLDYTNTFYHQEPRLDITAINPALAETVDILISSDVFEHVAPPISVAFENAFHLLKPGGTLILTVPYSFDSETIEHFPDLHQYQIQRVGGKPILRNVTSDGREQFFEKLNFHGGAGETLEMRRFSLDGLKVDLEQAGFRQIEILSEPDFRYGIYLKYAWSQPILARKLP